jgi:hypothetical protein
MVNRILIRVIEQGSDLLAAAVYRRILDDRRGARVRAAPNGLALTWTQIIAWALHERVLQPKEAGQLLDEMLNEDPGATSSGSRRTDKRRRSVLPRGTGDLRARSVKRRHA